VLAFRAAALLQAGPPLTRPRPTVLSTSTLRSGRIRHLLGPLAEHVDVMTASVWLATRFETLTGERAPSAGEIDWVEIGLAIARSGTPQARSVLVDDVHHLPAELAMTLRVLTENLFATTHVGMSRTGPEALNLPPSATLDRRRRQPRGILRVAHAWGDTEVSGATEGSSVPGEVVIAARGARTAVEEALARYKADRSLRIVITPIDQTHIPKIADLLIHLGLGRSRIFSSDVPPAALHSWDVGSPGIYVLRPGQTEGLEFDDTVMTGLEHLAGDPSESGTKRQLLSVANSTTRRLALHWTGSTVPHAVRLLHATGLISPNSHETV
jgi:hypothetical protein